MMKLFSVLIVVGFSVVFSAHAQDKKPVFIEIPPKLSGLEFINQIN